MKNNSSNKLTKREWCWVIYDVGNSAFTMIASSLFALFFGLLTDDAGIDGVLSDSIWGYATSIITVIAVLVGPLIGTLSDYKGFKKPIFLLLSVLGVLGCIALGIPMNYVIWLIIFVIAKVCYNGALMIYDSMLVDTTSEEKMDKVSSYGYALGYIGSCIPFIIGVVIVAFGFQNYNTDTPSMSASLSCPWGYLICFAINALWWLGFTLPLYFTYKQKYFVPKEKSVVKNSYKRLFTTFRFAKKHSGIFLFLIAFFCYIDGVYSIIELAMKVSENLGVDQVQALIAFIAVQFVAFPSAIIMSKLSKKYGNDKMIIACICGYLLITTFAIFISANWMFWVLAIGVGLFQGGIQSLSRSYFAQIIPHNKSGELFSLYDAFGKGASFLGTALFSTISLATNNTNLGIIPLPCLILVGGILFLIARKVNISKKEEISNVNRALEISSSNDVLEESSEN